MKSSVRFITATASMFAVLIGPASLALRAAETTPKEKAPTAPAAPKEKPAPKQTTEKSTNVAPKAAPPPPAPVAPKVAPKKKGIAGEVQEGTGI